MSHYSWAGLGRTIVATSSIRPSAGYLRANIMTLGPFTKMGAKNAPTCHPTPKENAVQDKPSRDCVKNCASSMREILDSFSACFISLREMTNERMIGPKDVAIAATILMATLKSSSTYLQLDIASIALTIPPRVLAKDGTTQITIAHEPRVRTPANAAKNKLHIFD